MDWARRIAIVVIGACSSPSGDGEDLDQFRGDVLRCEEAFARLERCCPTKPDPLDCNYSRRRGCNSDELITTLPEDGTSILAHSCREIVADGSCAAGTRPR